MIKKALVFTCSITVVMSSNLNEKEQLCSRARPESAANYPSLQIPTDNQNKFDVIYYRYNVNLDPDSNFTRAANNCRIRILDTSLTTIELNFTNSTSHGNQVDSVQLNGNTVSFTHTNHMLRIPVTQQLTLNQIIDINIYYTIGPEPFCNNCSFSWDSENGNDLIWTMSQPYDARDWWPCKDYPYDKIDSMEALITVPDHLVVASNGKLIAERNNGDGTKTYHWNESYPIATYLFSLSIYPFFYWEDEYVSANNDTVPITFYTFNDTNNSSPYYLVTNYKKTKPMMYAFVDMFGEYPFLGEKYGHAEWGLGYGMEHQTLTSMGDPTTRRVAHELAHMWWGDMITLNSYHHMWLNEGFARYAEALWQEHVGGVNAYQSTIASYEYYGSGTIYVEDPVNDNVFHFGLEYNKGAWVMHMLRRVLGDSTFFACLQAYGAHPDHRFKTATTEQFRDICESVSDQDLEQYFQQWIYGSHFPVYTINWQQINDSVQVNINQVQTTGTVFEMPIDLRMICSNTFYVTTVQNRMINEQYMLPLPPGNDINNIILDPDNWILNEVNYLHTNDETNEPGQFKVVSVYPNPFNPTLHIDFDVPHTGPVSVAIYNLLGNEITKLVDKSLEPGQYSLTWEADSQPSGIYFCQIKYNDIINTQKLTLLK